MLLSADIVTIRKAVASASTADRIANIAIRHAVKKRFEAGEVLLRIKDGLDDAAWRGVLDELGLGHREATGLMREAKPSSSTRAYALPTFFRLQHNGYNFYRS
jgi:hypothetical protein